MRGLADAVHVGLNAPTLAFGERLPLLVAALPRCALACFPNGSKKGIIMRRSILASTFFLLAFASRSFAYVEVPMSLGAVIAQSTVVCVMTVTKVDKTKNLIIYQKVADIKGKHPQDTIKHIISKELKPGEIKAIMAWAEPGKTAIFFHNGEPVRPAWA